MNLKVTLTFIATEDDWSISELIKESDNINTEEAKEIIKNALLEDATYVIENASIFLKRDYDSL